MACLTALHPKPCIALGDVRLGFNRIVMETHSLCNYLWANLNSSVKYRRDAIAVIGTPEFDHPDGRAKTFGSIERLNQVCVCVCAWEGVCVCEYRGSCRHTGHRLVWWKVWFRTAWCSRCWSVLKSRRRCLKSTGLRRAEENAEEQIEIQDPAIWKVQNWKRKSRT